jgi:hypothetical protein
LINPGITIEGLIISQKCVEKRDFKILRLLWQARIFKSYFATSSRKRKSTIYDLTYLLSSAGSDIARALPGGNTALTWLSTINGLGPNSTKDPNKESPGL